MQGVGIFRSAFNERTGVRRQDASTSAGAAIAEPANLDDSAAIPSEAEIFENIAQSLSQRIARENLHLNSKLKKDLKLDTLDIVGIVLNLQEQFHTTLPDNDIGKFNTVQDIINCAMDSINGKKKPKIK